jgi:ABC-type phosphate transport system auxiliary subunit
MGLLAVEEELINKNEHTELLKKKADVQRRYQKVKQVLESELLLKQQMIEKEHCYTLQKLKQCFQVWAFNLGKEARDSQGHDFKSSATKTQARTGPRKNSVYPRSYF